MSSDISYWLAEVESLQRQLRETQQQRDEAYQESYNWRQRYETEALQRRRETQGWQADLKTLKETIAQLQSQADLAAAEGSSGTGLPAEWLQDRISVAELQQQLQMLWQERDRYRQALAEERRAHGQTRQNLTLALGDAVDQLKRLKGETEA
jgi:chromosome segregation ATPase